MRRKATVAVNKDSTTFPNSVLQGVKTVIDGFDNSRSALIEYSENTALIMPTYFVIFVICTIAAFIKPENSG